MLKSGIILLYMLFLGFSTSVYAEDAEVDWLATADIKSGEKIFSQLCIYCHKLDYDDKFGPGLAGILDRQDYTWLSAFLEDPEKLIKTDEYAQSLHENNEYSLVMPKFPSMQDKKKRDDVIAYMGTLE